MTSVDENDSIWLFEILDSIGVSDKHRKACQRESITFEIIQTFNNSEPISIYNFGSWSEGTVTPGESKDLDVMICNESFPVIQDIANVDKKSLSYLIFTESNTPAGYVKLQLVLVGVPCTSIHWPLVYHKRIFTIDKREKIVICDLPRTYLPFMSRAKNKPALKSTTYKNPNLDTKIDTVVCYRCRSWPTVAREYLYRQRLHGWPTQETIKELKSLGFFVVRKGHPLSEEIDLEWRISLSLQERKLMFNLTDVQYKCYIVLKMLNENNVKLDCLTSFHWKTCLFYVIENSKSSDWEKKQLFHCIRMCVKQMLKWVKLGVCPNYFIPKDNLFDGRLHKSWRLQSEKKLEEIINEGFDCFLRVQTSNICDFVKLRGSLEKSLQLQSKCKQVTKEVLYSKKMSMYVGVLQVFNRRILEHDEASGNITSFIKFLWLKLNQIEHVGTITEHTRKETQCVLSLLTPYIYMCLAGHISSMAIQNSNPKVRDFLLLGSYTYYMKGDLSGRLKFISVLYAAGLYQDCEWWLNLQDENTVKHISSRCLCRHIQKESKKANAKYIEILQLNVSTCVSFLPNELLITPDALKYEMYRCIGVYLEENQKVSEAFSWHHRVVVDSNVYFFLLKYLIKRKLGKVEESNEAVYSIHFLLSGPNVRHLDVACNLVAWLFCSNNNTPLTLLYSSLSWKIMNAWDLCYTIFDEEMKSKPYQFNSGKIHALVSLYNTWFARKSPSIQFCFRCLAFSPKKLQQCSRCKVAIYCSRQCQKIDWKFHKVVCQIVRRVLM